MHVKEARIRDFRRFTDLIITNLPESIRLVVLAGPNGNGKSSLFDAFKQWITPWIGVEWTRARGHLMPPKARPSLPLSPNLDACGRADHDGVREAEEEAVLDDADRRFDRGSEVVQGKGGW